MELENQTEDVPMFSLNGYVTDAKVVRVYDGDTIHVVFHYFGKFYKWIGRIAHVDTPELRTKNLDEKKKGYEVRDKLRELILGKVVKLTCQEFDKYGRLLLDIQIGDIKVDEWLISNGYAKKYEGGTKEKW
jgi:endonuclease YncB( thermonuclease family)